MLLLSVSGRHTTQPGCPMMHWTGGVPDEQRKKRVRYGNSNSPGGLGRTILSILLVLTRTAVYLVLLFRAALLMRTTDGREESLVVLGANTHSS